MTELHAELCGAAGYSGDWPSFVEDWCCHLVLIPSMLALVERLATAHRVLIFSNTNLEHWNHVVGASADRIGAFERVLSYEIGMAKPAIGAFDALAEAAGLTADDMLFFDDVAANVAGARRAGLHAELFTGEGPLRALLSQRGLWS